MRDPKKLKAFELADQLVVEIYKATKKYPREELYGLTSQIRRAAVSVPANIVEGCARATQKDYLHFLTMAYGSLAEVGYFLELSVKLGYLEQAPFEHLHAMQTQAAKTLFGLLKSFEA